ncbi:conserved hypothetical protein [Methylocella tundrae]|uniref:Uncharacterized protein n=1 Tax=Methylocella tundrae TaxID=227605 RepID=A0A8B6M8B7_METTU|nr:hypothetical protein [Methylocella tundrae]VTZ50545.1 conserved hypothetical protein [Methylocella tundrae]
MATALEQIGAKIAELEAKIADLRVAERELLSLEKAAARKTGTASAPKPRQKPRPKAALKAEATATRRPKLGGEKASEPSATRQTIGAAITEVLGQQGALSATKISAHIKAMGQDVSNRSVSFALQALKKRGLAKNTDGKWAAPKTRGRRARPSPEASGGETEVAG